MIKRLPLPSEIRKKEEYMNDATIEQLRITYFRLLKLIHNLRTVLQKNIQQERQIVRKNILEVSVVVSSLGGGPIGIIVTANAYLAKAALQSYRPNTEPDYTTSIKKIGREMGTCMKEINQALAKLSAKEAERFCSSLGIPVKEVEEGRLEIHQSNIGWNSNPRNYNEKAEMPVITFTGVETP